MTYPYTGVILAGGLNTRFNGSNKAFLKLGKKRIIDRILGVLQSLFDEIVIISNIPSDYLEWDVLIGADLYPVRSSLTGIHAGLFYSNRSYSFITACDTPFLKKELIEAIVSQTDPEYDIVVPYTSKGFEPLCALYSQNCLKVIENRIVSGKLKINYLFEHVRTRKVKEETLKAYDPELNSFINVNTPGELEKAEKKLADLKQVDAQSI